jgi:hypothetical protein
MIRTVKSYFNPDGTLKGEMVIFVPEGEEKLHADGVSIIRKDGSVFRQENPYVTKPKYTNLGLIEVDGEYGGEYRLRNGRVEKIPENEKPARPKTAEQRIAELEDRIAAMESKK